MTDNCNNNGGTYDPAKELRQNWGSLDREEIADLMDDLTRQERSEITKERAKKKGGLGTMGAIGDSFGDQVEANQAEETARKNWRRRQEETEEE